MKSSNLSRRSALVARAFMLIDLVVRDMLSTLRMHQLYAAYDKENVVSGAGKSMKKTKKPSFSDVSDFAFTLPPRSPNDAAARYVRSIAQAFTSDANASDTNQRTERLFIITSEILFQFAKNWKVRPPIRRGARLSSTAVNKISAEMDLFRRAPGPKTIQKCFEYPDDVQRVGAALVTRQLLCIALGSLSGTISIQGAALSVRDAQALANDVGNSLNSRVSETEVHQALDSALEVALDPRKHEKRKSGA